MRSIETMQVGDVYAHSAGGPVWLVLDTIREEFVDDVAIIRYRCVELTSGVVDWHFARVDLMIDDAWELYRP